MPSHLPTAYVAATAADISLSPVVYEAVATANGLVFAHRQEQLLQMPLWWPIAYAVAAAADAFALTRRMCNGSDCQWLRIGSLHMQLW